MSRAMEWTGAGAGEQRPRAGIACQKQGAHQQGNAGKWEQKEGGPHSREPVVQPSMEMPRWFELGPRNQGREKKEVGKKRLLWNSSGIFAGKERALTSTHKHVLKCMHIHKHAPHVVSMHP